MLASRVVPSASAISGGLGIGDVLDEPQGFEALFDRVAPRQMSLLKARRGFSMAGSKTWV